MRENTVFSSFKPSKGLSLGLFWGLVLSLHLGWPQDLVGLFVPRVKAPVNAVLGVKKAFGLEVNQLDAGESARPIIDGPFSSSQKTNSQKELTKLLNLKPEKDPLDIVHNQSLSQAGYQIALATGARVRYEEILALVESKAAELDEIFDFEPLLVKAGRLYLEPPVVAATSELVSLREPLTGYERGQAYRLIRAGRFLGEIPTWRTYLIPPLMTATSEPDPIHGSLRPSDAAEKKVWAKAVVKGFTEGQARAKNAFEAAFSQLARDYLGLIRFWELKEKGLVMGPKIATASTPFKATPETLIWDETALVIAEPGRFLDPTPPVTKNRPKKSKPKASSPQGVKTAKRSQS